MELEGDLGVETEGEVVVEDAEGQRVADVARAGRLVGRRLGVLLDEQLPPVQVHHLAVVHRRQYLRDRLVRVALRVGSVRFFSLKKLNQTQPNQPTNQPANTTKARPWRRHEEPGQAQ